MKKFMGLLLAASLLAGSISTGGIPGVDRQAGMPQEPSGVAVASAEEATVVPATVQAGFRELTSDALTEEMGAGWNLGNTFDGHTGFTPGETVWQHVETTKSLIKSVHDLGFNTIRIPVTWGTMIDDEHGFAINEKWISRIQDVVDYAIEQDMYVIINIHHDGAEQTGWLRIASEDIQSVKTKFEGVWKNIACRFKDYDEHLIFEAMNEVQGTGGMTDREQTQIIMQLNQIFVDTVRATGSNNVKRWLMVTGKYNTIYSVTNKNCEFSLPADTVANRLLVSVHMYSPWSFCGMESPGKRKLTASEVKSYQNELKAAYETYSSQGIPVVVGEYGSINKNNTKQRAYHMETINRIYAQYKMIGCYWDQGWFDLSQKYDYSFSVIDRETGQPIRKKITDAMMRGFYTDTETDCSKIKRNTKVTEFDSLAVSETNVALTIGEEKKLGAATTPENANDVLLWKTDNASVATVYNGKIRARGIGTTLVTAYSQSGSVSQQVTVTVNAAPSQNPCTSIASADAYALTVDDYVYVNAVAGPAGTDAYISYASENDAVATVSTLGKIVAKGVGTTVITATASTGLQKRITVTVGEKPVSAEIRLALNVYYNDGSHDYYSNEVSKDVITVSGNGQYTVTFDCEKDLSEEAKKAGITNLNNITAIYIKDYDVTLGTNSQSPFSVCNIMYDKIVVNDSTELTITQTAPKSALKASGIFDTNDPINSWDGSAVKEVTTASQKSSFSTVKNPTKISVTFTLSDIVIGGAAVSDPQETPEPEDETGEDVPKKGSTVTYKKVSYKVTKSAAKNGTVAVTGIKGKSGKSIVIPKKVTIDGYSFKVTEIGKNAFKNCSSLKKITIKSKTITKIGKNAFKGTDESIVIKVPGSKKKAYQKLAGKAGYSGKLK